MGTFLILQAPYAGRFSLSVVQRGYKLHDRVLRPAMVVVGKGKTETEEGADKPDNDPNTKGEH